MKIISAMFNFNYVPPKLNRGITITVHEGGRKRKDDLANYRAITLTSSILNFYEGIMLRRSQSDILDKLNIQARRLSVTIRVHDDVFFLKGVHPVCRRKP